MALKPWREVAVPHNDVLNGTSLQSDFAADLNTVASGEAKSEYQDASLFYSRTYITEGMSLLLKNVMMRLNGKGGEPVIQLKTSFGGGKTHSMIAVYHLAKRQCNLTDLQGVSPLLDSLGLNDVPQAQVAVLDGNALSPGQTWPRGSHEIQTLWGELAWQIGGEEGYKLIEDSDKNKTSPGKELLAKLLSDFGPCVILVDELLAFVRQLLGNDNLPAGTFNANISFVQALTEACKIVPNCIMLASLPESDAELGTSGAKEALESLEKYFGRVQAIWKPVATEESFEIVRRRLFKEISDEKAKKEVCRAFFDMYKAEGNAVPSETQESAYLERLERAYPIHPQLFDTLYEEWATLEKFQKTRGTLKLLSTIIYTLWKQSNSDYLIMNSSLPLSDGKVSTELCAVLNDNGWEQVIMRDIDGDSSESAKIDLNDTRLGAIHSAKKVSRTIFLKTSPLPSEINSTEKITAKQNAKGVSFDYILLGCLQPGQNTSLYSDALAKLCDKLHYLSVSGSGASSEKRYYRFATHANMRKEMEDRANRIKDNAPELIGLLNSELKELTKSSGLFSGIHCFTEHADVPDDEALRLVLLSPNDCYSTSPELSRAQISVKNYLSQCGEKMRVHQNRLVFVAPDSKQIAQVETTAKKHIAWKSIIDDAKNMRLNVDMLQLRNAENEFNAITQTLGRQIQSCWKFILYPEQGDMYSKEISIECIAVNLNASFIQSIEKECLENEIVISKWGAIHLNNMLKKVFWHTEQKSLAVREVWDATTKYLYLERLKDKSVFEQTVIQGASSKDYFAVADGAEGEKYLGLHFGNAITFVTDDTLIVPKETAQAQIENESATAQNITAQTGSTTNSSDIVQPSQNSSAPSGEAATEITQSKKPTHFYLEHQVQAGMLSVQANKIYEEIISVLNQSIDANIKVSISIEANFKNGAEDNIVRAVKENASTLNIGTSEWS